jgi:phosphoribosylformylglycinamidine (FGAM) synthase PurS component
MTTVMGLVSWKAVNPEAVTALITLRDTMGVPVADIAVGTLYSAEIADSVTDGIGYFRRMLEETGILYNPNRDHHLIIRSFDELNRQPANNGSLVRWVMVWEGDGEQPDLLGKLQQRYGFTELKRISLAKLWRLEIAAQSELEADELCKKIVETESRTQGLLVNPHSQNWKLV